LNLAALCPVNRRRPVLDNGLRRRSNANSTPRHEDGDSTISMSVQGDHPARIGLQGRPDSGAGVLHVPRSLEHGVPGRGETSRRREAIQVRRHGCRIGTEPAARERSGRRRDARGLDTKIANTVGFLAGVLIKSIETGEMERRLAAIESAVTGQSGMTGESAFDRPAPLLEGCP
jgi:hypothetical protein